MFETYGKVKVNGLEYRFELYDPVDPRYKSLVAGWEAVWRAQQSEL